MAILNFNRWERVGYEVQAPVEAKDETPAVPGVYLYMKMKRLRRHEVKPLAKVLIAVFEEIQKSSGDELSMSQKAEIVSRAYDLIPEEELKEQVASCIKDIEAEYDGQSMDAASLLEEADNGLIFWMLMTLINLSKLSVVEGNASASRSTLRLAVGGNGPSPAQSTEREAGPEPSTATGTQDEKRLSTSQG